MEKRKLKADTRPLKPAELSPIKRAAILSVDREKTTQTNDMERMCRYEHNNEAFQVVMH
jgi:hypothetical protein